jgi:hypothetical protein
VWHHPPKRDRNNVFYVTSSSTPLLPPAAYLFSAESPGHCSAWVVKLNASANQDSELSRLRLKFLSASEALTACEKQEENMRQHISVLVQQNQSLCLQLEVQQRQLLDYASNLQQIYDANAKREEERETALLEMAVAAMDRKQAAEEAARDRETRERAEAERMIDAVS